MAPLMGHSRDHFVACVAYTEAKGQYSNYDRAREIDFIIPGWRCSSIWPASKRVSKGSFAL